jgi:hypothetical protein
VRFTYVDIRKPRASFPSLATAFEETQPMRPVWVVFPLMCAALSLTCLAQDERRPVTTERSVSGFETKGGTVNRTEGDVRVRSAVANSNRILLRGQLANGDLVITHAGSRAEILLSPAYYVRLGENTTCLIADLASDNQKLNLFAGTLIIEILQNNAGTFGENAYELVTLCTPHGECCIKEGGLFLLRVGETQSRIAALKGEALVLNSKVREGNEATMRAGSVVAITSTAPGNEEFLQWSADRAHVLQETNKELKNEDWYKARQKGSLLTIDERSEQANDVFTTSAAMGKVSFVEDGVEYQRRGADWAPLPSHSSMKEGDRIRSRAGSRTQLILTPGVFLTISGQSELSFLQIAAGRMRISLARGSAIIDAVAGDALKGFSVALLTAQGDIALSQPGEYRFNVLPEATEILVRRGRIVMGAEVKQGHRMILAGGEGKISGFDRHAEDTFDVWSHRRERDLGGQSRQSWLEAKRVKLNRASRTGVWYFSAKAGWFTFVPGLWDFKSPYGGSYPVKIRFRGQTRPRSPGLPWDPRPPN